MDKRTLVERDQEIGARLIRALDERGFDVRTAFWFYFPESDIWRLVISSPKIARDPRGAYGVIHSIIDDDPEFEGLSIVDISLLSPKRRLVQVMRSAAHTEPDEIAGIRFTRNLADRTFIDDAYIYRAA